MTLRITAVWMWRPRLPQDRKGEAGDPEINSGSVFGWLCNDRVLFQEKLIYQPWRGQRCQRRSSCPWEAPKSFYPLLATPPGHSNDEPVQGSGVLPSHSSLPPLRLPGSSSGTSIHIMCDFFFFFLTHSGNPKPSLDSHP